MRAYQPSRLGFYFIVFFEEEINKIDINLTRSEWLNGRAAIQRHFRAPVPYTR